MNQPLTPIVEFRDASLELDGDQRILSDLSFDVRTGEVLVLLGRSGSGKTAPSSTSWPAASPMTG